MPGVPDEPEGIAAWAALLRAHAAVVPKLERRLAERCRLDAQAFPFFMTNLLNGVWVALQVVAGACVIGAALLGQSRGLLIALGEVTLIGFAVVAAAISALPAALAAAVVVIHRSDLDRRHVVNGTGPWVAIVIEATVVAAIWRPWA